MHPGAVVLFYLQDGAGAGAVAAGAGAGLAGPATLDDRTAAARVEAASYSVLQALLNPRVLYLAATYFTNVCHEQRHRCSSCRMILKGFGLSNAQTGLVAAIPSAAALVAVIWWGRRSDAGKERYGHAALRQSSWAARRCWLRCCWPIRLLRIAAVTVAFAGDAVVHRRRSGPSRATFLSGVGAAGGYRRDQLARRDRRFRRADWFIGYLRGVTGDFRGGGSGWDRGPRDG